MKTTRSSAVIGVLALAGALALAVTRPRPVVLVRLAVDEAALGLEPTPTLRPIPLPATFDEVRFDLDGGPIEVELWAGREPVSARAAHTGDLTRMLGLGRHCRIDEALVARCEEERGGISLCGNRPFPGPLASTDPDRFTRWHSMGTGDGRLSDERGGELATPYGPDAAMALDEGVLLVADDASSRLRAHVLPATWGGELDRGIDLGPTRTRGAFGRCDLGEVRALHAGSGEVLIGAGRRWSRYETALEGGVLGLWSCHEGALHRVDVDDAALHVVACRAAGCATTEVPLPPELVGAAASDAVHLGGSVAILFTDARALRRAMLGAEGFTPSQPVAWRASLSRPSGEPSLLVHEDRLYAGLVTIAGPAVLVIDATGEVRWVRPATPAPPATFAGAELVPLDEDIELVRSRLDAPFRLTHAEPIVDDGRACSLRPTLATELSFRCTPSRMFPVPLRHGPGTVEVGEILRAFRGLHPEVRGRRKTETDSKSS